MLDRRERGSGVRITTIRMHGDFGWCFPRPMDRCSLSYLYLLITYVLLMYRAQSLLLVCSSLASCLDARHSRATRRQ